MASIVKRNNHYCVVYLYTDQNGQKKQKWETYKTMPEAKARQKEIEYKAETGGLVITPCKTLEELLKEYVALYGKNKWAISTYSRNVSLIDHYINPMLGSMKLNEISPRVVEAFYQQLLKTKTFEQPKSKKKGSHKESYVTTGIIREIHKILRSCFTQAMKWELMEKNPASLATVPKHEKHAREIWTAETLFHAIELCDDERLKLALNLAFSCSLRKGELLGLTWDCVDITDESIANGSACITINKELQRVSKAAAEAVENKDIILTFPSKSSQTKTILVLKAPKTYSSIRKVFLPLTVAEMLKAWKTRQNYEKEALGNEYQDYNLVLAGPLGLPTESSTITDGFNRLIKENDLPEVVFHSLRHSSITYKLKLNGGDVKAVQGDSGHAQASMVTEVYSHILDDDRKKNAALFEKAFYSGKGSDGDGGDAEEEKSTPEKPSSDMEMLMKLLGNPETAALLKALAKAMDN